MVSLIRLARITTPTIPIIIAIQYNVFGFTEKINTNPLKRRFPTMNPKIIPNIVFINSAMQTTKIPNIIPNKIDTILN